MAARVADLFENNVNLPDPFIRNLRDIHEGADTWLAQLDANIQRCEERWQVHVTGLVPNLSYNIVAYARGLDNTPYILKLSPPNSEFTQEIAALKLYNGDGICRLIDADDTVGVMLLERLEPGISFWNTDVNNAQEDDLSTRTAATLMHQLWRPVSEPHPFRTLKSWTRALPKYLNTYPNGNGPLPHALLQQAYDLLNGLLADSDESVLLHADLHHDNIVSAGRQPHLAIDPKGIVGPRGYDVGSFLINPKPRVAQSPRLREVLGRRIAIFSDTLDLSTQEVAAWGVVHTALEMCWTLEDHGDGWQASVAVGGELRSFL